MAGRKINLAVLISGNGSNLQALIDACEREDYPARVAVVISNNQNAYGLARAKNAGIDAHCIDHTNFKTRINFEQEILEVLDQYPIDLICLAGFMRIFSADFFTHWTKPIINTHPALLPKFGGKGMYGAHVHQAVLEAGEKESGASVHYVIPAVDQGEVIVQKRVPVMADDTIDSLSGRVIAQEYIAYVEAVEHIAKKIS